MLRNIPPPWRFNLRDKHTGLPAIAMAVIVLLVTLGAPAQAASITPTEGTLDCGTASTTGSWRACAVGFASVGPDPSTGGSSGGLGFILLTEIVPTQSGLVRAEIPEDPVLIVGNFTFNVKADTSKETGTLIITFPMGLTFPTDHGGFVQIAGGSPFAPGPYSVAFPLHADNDYTAEVTSFAYANGATDAHGLIVTKTDAVAHTAAGSLSSKDGTPASLPVRVGPIFSVSGSTRVSIDGGPLAEIQSYTWARDANGKVTTNNIATNLPSGPLLPGAYSAVGSFQQSWVFGPGTHNVHFEHTLTGFLQDQVLDAPEPSTMTLFGTALFLLGGRWLQRRKT